LTADADGACFGGIPAPLVLLSLILAKNGS
jgi:hypothetical protein